MAENSVQHNEAMKTIYSFHFIRNLIAATLVALVVVSPAFARNNKPDAPKLMYVEKQTWFETMVASHLQVQPEGKKVGLKTIVAQIVKDFPETEDLRQLDLEIGQKNGMLFLNCMPRIRLQLSVKLS